MSASAAEPEQYEPTPGARCLGKTPRLRLVRPASGRTEHNGVSGLVPSPRGPRPARPSRTPSEYVTSSDTPLTIRAPYDLGAEAGVTGDIVRRHGRAGHGHVTVDPDGSLTYVPAPGFVGRDVIRYEIWGSTPNDPEYHFGWATLTVIVRAAPTR